MVKNFTGMKLISNKYFFPKWFSEKLFVSVEGIMNTMINVLTYYHGGDLGSEG